jgi:DNA polymerase/3'-5' exonuclease PolX
VLPFAIFYFTGSDYFNRSLRNYVGKLGWTLCDHGLSRVLKSFNKETGAMEREWEGRSIKVACEADIFRAICAPYRAPHEREC